MNYEAALRRAVQTRVECRAAIESQRPFEPFDWHVHYECNEEPGHAGPHQDWSERDGMAIADWEDDRKPVLDCPPVAVTTGELIALRTVPSPWTPDELAALAAVHSEVPEAGEAESGRPTGRPSPSFDPMLGGGGRSVLNESPDP